MGEPSPAATTAKPVYLFYHIQNERGESSSHPNACTLTVPPGSKVVLQDVLNAFPLRGTGSFHFRFQVAQDGVVMFLDVLDPSDPVPMVGGNVIAKVLRLDTMKCAARQAFALQPRQTSASSRASDIGYFSSQAGGASPLPTGAAARPAPSAGAETSFSSASGLVNRVASAVGFGPRSAAASSEQQQVQRPPAAAAAGLTSPTPQQQQPPRQQQPRGSPSLSSASEPSPASSTASGPPAIPAAAVIPMLKPVKAVIIDTAAVITPPEHVDDDLKDKSAYVQAKVSIIISMKHRGRRAPTNHAAFMCSLLSDSVAAGDGA
jgi:DIX domain